MKKTWQQPKLVILVRGRPEEAILTFCKTDDLSIAGPSTNVGTCAYYKPNPSVCTMGDCNTVTAS